MSSRHLSTALVLLGLALCAVSASAQDDKGQAEGMPPMGPPAELEKMAYMEGSWNIDVKHRMDPNSEFVEGTATADVKPILQGAAYQMHWKGQMFGMPFEGILIQTYDREDKRYESFWIDSFAARGSEMTGGFKDGRMVLSGEGTHEGQPYKMRMTNEKKSNDEWHSVMETSRDGGQTFFTTMQMVYKRASS